MWLFVTEMVELFSNMANVTFGHKNGWSGFWHDQCDFGRDVAFLLWWTRQRTIYTLINSWFTFWQEYLEPFNTQTLLFNKIQWETTNFLQKGIAYILTIILIPHSPKSFLLFIFYFNIFHWYWNSILTREMILDCGVPKWSPKCILFISEESLWFLTVFC